MRNCMQFVNAFFADFLHDLLFFRLKMICSCPFCGSIFSRMWNLQRHLLAIHEGSFHEGSCDLCGEGFTVFDEFLDHLWLHYSRNSRRQRTVEETLDVFTETPLEDNPVQTPTELEEIEGEVESSDPEEEERIAVQMEMGTYDMEEAPDWMLEEESSSEDDADENDFDDYNFNVLSWSIPDFSASDTFKLKVLREAIAFKWSEKQYESHCTRLLSNDSDTAGLLPQTLKTLRAWAMRKLNVLFNISTAFFHRGHRQGYQSLISVVAFWLAHCDTFASLKSMSEEMLHVLLGSTRAELDRKYGSELLNSLWRTRGDWAASFARALEEGHPVLFVNFNFYADGFDVYSRRMEGFWALCVSATQLGPELRCRTPSPATPLLTVCNTAAYNEHRWEPFFRLMLRELEQLSRGMLMFSPVAQRTVLVIATTDRVLGDMPARSEFAGYKKPTMNANAPCHECLISGCDIPAHLASSFPYRDANSAPEFYSANGTHKIVPQLRGATTVPQTDQDSITRETYGINLSVGISPSDFPGFSPADGIAIDLMHQAPEGDVILHWQEFSRLLVSLFLPLNFWSILYSLLSDHFQKMYLPRVHNFSKGWNYWYHGLNAHGKLQFFLHSVGVLEMAFGHLPEGLPSVLEQHWDCWKMHVQIVGIMCQFEISERDRSTLKQLIARWVPVFIELYSHPVLNTHQLTHMPKQIDALGSPRLNWCFPFESILGTIKKFQRQASNHRSAGWSALRHYWLRQVLDLLVCPGMQFQLRVTRFPMRRQERQDPSVLQALQLHGLNPAVSLILSKVHFDSFRIGIRSLIRLEDNCVLFVLAIASLPPDDIFLLGKKCFFLDGHFFVSEEDAMSNVVAVKHVIHYFTGRNPADLFPVGLNIDLGDLLFIEENA
eukprot:GCRY01003869.1.p1 GENE.GCRY01003869.1~~GCRY01003869.1.p1  ORF type:complete len:889 (+),score=129.30 GCRY01003869.1:65-2731(+)